MSYSACQDHEESVRLQKHACSYTDLLKGFSKLSSGGHAQLFRNVSRDFEQQYLHEARHHSILRWKERKVGNTSTVLSYFKKKFIT